MNSFRQTGQTRPWYREPWPWLLMAGPAAVIVAGLVTAWLAVVSNDGLVDDDYYKQGLAVNQRLSRDQAAHALGVEAELFFSGAQLRLLLIGKPDLQPPAQLMLRIVHPTRAGADQAITLDAEGAGMYRGQLAGKLAGRWRLLLESPTQNWRLQGEWEDRSGERVRLGAAAAS